MRYESKALELHQITLEINMQNDLEEYCLRLLKKSGVEPDTIDESRASYEYFNLLKRRIAPKPRKVYFSREFTYPQEYERALNIFVEKSEKGQSLQPYTSTSILEANFNDMLLEDWNIQHFHLNARFNEKTGFAKRSDYIMYAWVTDYALYMINTYLHKDKMAVYRKEMLQIIDNNWPKLLKPYHVKGAKELTEHLSDEQYKMLRDNGITTFVELGPNKVYTLMGGGYSSDCSSGEAIRTANFWHNRMYQIEKAIFESIWIISDAMDNRRDFRLKLLWMTGKIKQSEEYTFIETNSGNVVQYNVSNHYYRICRPVDLYWDFIE